MEQDAGVGRVNACLLVNLRSELHGFFNFAEERARVLGGHRLERSQPLLQGHEQVDFQLGGGRGGEEGGVELRGGWGCVTWT